MPNWGDVLNEIQIVGQQPGPVDLVRRKYTKELHKYTKRNIILYYSGWLQRGDSPIQSMIYDGDINCFMAAVNNMDTSLGLDLILHTPGGVTSATEAIVSYLRKKFDRDIRCFIPQLAMSGGTMIACASKEIFMGKQSSIGPIDPQFGSMAALAVIDEFKKATSEIAKNPASTPLWQSIFAKIPPGFLVNCQQAVDLSQTLVKEWLISGMFYQSKNAEAEARKIVNALNNHRDTKAHDRHIDSVQAIEMGLKINMLEKDQKLQDLVLTVHHACMHTFSQSPNLHKIVENQMGVGTFISGN
ncbi:MAG: S49 family peptidase [Kiritimatiellae bacterium]|nr:S49 family peptidase [Kiritimatiellia bacterium]